MPRPTVDLSALERYEISAALEIALKEAKEFEAKAEQRGAAHMVTYWARCVDRIAATKAKIDSAMFVTITQFSVTEGTRLSTANGDYAKDED